MAKKTFDLDDKGYWKGLTKKQKRATNVNLTNGRKVRALDWIDEQDKKLPECFLPDGKKVNHRGKMRDIFMGDGGVKDVSIYIEAVVKMYNEQIELAAQFGGKVVAGVEKAEIIPVEKAGEE